MKVYVLAGAIFSAALSAGCSSSAKPPKIDETKIKLFAERGYDSGIDYTTSTTSLPLNIGNGIRQVTIVQPELDGKYPVVIYLPGLGESDSAAQQMRNVWAKSGYVVLSVQPLQDDVSIWSSKAARSGDFLYLRRERYASEVVSARISIILKLLEYLKHASVSGDTNLQRMDLSRLAIAGFDIGASAAMIIAGEDIPNISNEGLSRQTGAVIALSPYADFSGSSFDVRYRNISMPVLSVTSDADSNTNDSIPAALHQAPFQYMPPGNKYLLLLSGASHSTIGNEDPLKPAAANGDDKHPQTGHEGGSEDSDRAHGTRHGSKSGNGDNPTGYSRRAAAESPTQRALMEVAIEQVSTAFLNAYIKNDQFSKDWLTKDAQPWLHEMGQLKAK